jgi:hypothetical protein
MLFDGGTEHHKQKQPSLPRAVSSDRYADQMEKLEPQPQVVVALGLVTVKREPSRPSV